MGLHLRPLFSFFFFWVKQDLVIGQQQLGGAGLRPLFFLGGVLTRPSLGAWSSWLGWGQRGYRCNRGISLLWEQGA